MIATEHSSITQYVAKMGNLLYFKDVFCFLILVSDSKSPVFPFDDATSWPYTVEGLNQYDLEEDLFDGVEPLMKYARIPAVLWSAEDVVSFIR